MHGNSTGSSPMFLNRCSSWEGITKPPLQRFLSSSFHQGFAFQNENLVFMLMPLQRRVTSHLNGKQSKLYPIGADTLVKQILNFHCFGAFSFEGVLPHRSTLVTYTNYSSCMPSIKRANIGFQRHFYSTLVFCATSKKHGVFPIYSAAVKTFLSSFLAFS